MIMHDMLGAAHLNLGCSTASHHSTFILHLLTNKLTLCICKDVHGILVHVITARCLLVMRPAETAISKEGLLYAVKRYRNLGHTKTEAHAI